LDSESNHSLLESIRVGRAARCDDCVLWVVCVRHCVICSATTLDASVPRGTLQALHYLRHRFGSDIYGVGIHVSAVDGGWSQDRRSRLPSDGDLRLRLDWLRSASTPGLYPDSTGPAIRLHAVAPSDGGVRRECFPGGCVFTGGPGTAADFGVYWCLRHDRWHS